MGRVHRRNGLHHWTENIQYVGDLTALNTLASTSMANTLPSLEQFNIITVRIAISVYVSPGVSIMKKMLPH